MEPDHVVGEDPLMSKQMVGWMAQAVLAGQLVEMMNGQVVCRHYAVPGEEKAVRQWIERRLREVGLRVVKYVPDDGPLDRICAVVGEV